MSDENTNTAKPSPRPRKSSKPAEGMQIDGMQNQGTQAAAPPPPPPPAARPLPNRALRMALVVSVALNLMVAGLVVGSFLRKDDWRGRGGDMTRDLGFGPFAESLRPEDRAALRGYLQARAPELRNAMTQRRRDIATIQAALRADPFDAAAFEAALGQMRGRLESQLTLGFDGLTSVVLAMPADQRRALADRLDRGLRGDARPDRRDAHGSDQRGGDQHGGGVKDD